MVVKGAKKMNVMIVGNWATNKGDRAVLTFMVKQLQNNDSVKKIYVATTIPELYEGRLNLGEKVCYVPFGCNVFEEKGNNIYSKIKRRFLYKKYFSICFPKMIEEINAGRRKFRRNWCDRRFYKAIQDSDYLLLTGGHHITSMREYDSLHSLTYELGLMYLTQKPYSLWAQTIGPLDIKEDKNKQFLLKIIGNADKVYIRDKNSRKSLEVMGYQSNNLHNTNDSVFGMYNFCSKNYVQEKTSGIVGISIFYSNMRRIEEVQEYVDNMSKLCAYILGKGYHIRFFPMETEQKEIDIIQQIIRKTNQSEKIEIYDTDVITERHILAVNECEMFVGHKTHSIIMALTTNTPLIALCYHEKTMDFMKMYELEEYAIDDKCYSFEWFKKQFDLLENNREAISEQMDKKSKRYSKEVCDEFDKIF